MNTSPRFTARCVLLTSLLLARSASADDLADEADLKFEVGTEAYQARQYRVALEHFLTSNRLVPNRNVVFNIANCYEALGRFADAHRYYSLALQGEADAAARAAIEQSLARIAPRVAVLRVASDPPGATIYIDRRDLGPRGTTPRAMAFAPGRYRVIAELDGYEPVTSEPIELRLGDATPVTLRLSPVLGAVHLESDAPASVRVDDERADARCATPCDLSLRPGRHRFFFSADGYQVATEEVDVVARETTPARGRMVPLTGSVVVSADERDALVEVDGRAMGFTPAVVNVQVGTRRVRISLPGYRPIERTLEVRTGAESRVDVALTRVEEVSAVSRTTESLDDAPSSVTVISGQEIRAMGYPTIAEALRGVRGVYLSNDGTYETVGFRGFGLPGSYGNRVLVLVDGHPANENWYNGSFIAYDARADLEDVERIEVVRGPGSVLYGSNAFSGIINVVTRGRTAPNGGDVGLSTSQYGTVRGRAGVRWSRGNMGFWASVAGAYGVGRDFYFPELARPAMGTTPAVDGYSRGADGFQAGTVTGRFWWRDFTLQWLYNVRHKSVATGEYDTQLGNPGTFWRDSRGFVEARFEPHLTDTVQLFTRAYANQFGFRSRYVYGGDVENDQEDFVGLVVGAEARVVWNPFRALRLTVGTEGQFHVLAQQTGGPVSNPTAYLNGDHPYQIAAGYISLDGSPTDWFRYSAAARLDWYSTFGATINPRLALIFHPYARGTLKVMGGSAFRAPAVAELYYQSESQLANPNVQPERTYSGEIEYSHRLSSAWTLLGSGFVNYTTNLIALADVPGMTDVIQYQNNATPIVTLGAEAEVRREWRQGWMASASYSFQRSRFTGADAAALREVPNSPEHLFSLRGSAPIVPGVFLVTSRLTFEGPRFDRNYRATDPAQGTTDLALLWDIVLSGRVDRWGLRYALGAYNIIDWRYAVPVSPELPTAAVPQNGRTFLASMGLDF